MAKHMPGTLAETYGGTYLAKELREAEDECWKANHALGEAEEARSRAYKRLVEIEDRIRRQQIDAEGATQRRLYGPDAGD